MRARRGLALAAACGVELAARAAGAQSLPSCAAQSDDVACPILLDAARGDRAPRGYRLAVRGRTKLRKAGAITFGATYGASVLLGGLASIRWSEGTPTYRNNWKPLFVPLLGPFITIGTAHASARGAIPLAVLGTAEVAGLGVFLAGLTTSSARWVRNDYRMQEDGDLVRRVGRDAPFADDVATADGWRATPDGYHLGRAPDDRFIAAGATLFGATYLASVVVRATALEGREWDALYVPIAGPLVALASRHSRDSELGILAVDGIGQLGGAALFAVGLLKTRRVLIRDGSEASFTILPGAAGAAFGVSAVGSL